MMRSTDYRPEGRQGSELVNVLAIFIVNVVAWAGLIIVVVFGYDLLRKAWECWKTVCR